MKRYVTDFMEYVGDDPARASLADTPGRVLRSWDKLFGGYRQDPARIFRFFECPENSDIVILKNIDFYSTCEHHLLPFFGELHIGYLPDGKITGISKLARLAELHARRLQLQERLVSDIADDIEKFLEPRGVIVTAQAQHFCMTSRGVQKQRTKMVATAARGLFKQQAHRAEFFSLLGL
ncbi:MAG: GTP cyclohydrolase I FolE [Elusimicrobiaceae bacterium]|nr:GTP cyclohydrolase I FolE [Elusimicrobiaceae bacterium]